MAGTTLYPTAIDADQNNIDNVDVVLAADVNDAQKAANAAQIALGAQPVTGISDSVSYSGGMLAAPNVLGGYNGTATNYPSNPQVGWASIIATQIKSITGKANYRTQPGASIATILSRPFITNGSDATLTGETPIATVINAGPLGSRPAAAAANAGWLWVVTSGGTTASPNLSVARSDGSNWINVAFYTNGSFGSGDLTYWDDSNKQWTRLAIGSAGQVLTVSSGIPAWVTLTSSAIGAIPASVGTTNGDVLVYSGGAWTRLGAGTVGQVLTIGGGGMPTWSAVAQTGDMVMLPSVYVPAKQWYQFATIADAITFSANFYSTNTIEVPVCLPPKDYTSEGVIALADHVPLVELVPGTVTLGGVSMSGGLNFFVRVHRIARTIDGGSSTNYGVVDAQDCAATIIAHEIAGTIGTATSNTLSGVLTHTTASTLVIYADKITMTATDTDAAYGVYNNRAGSTINLHGTHIAGVNAGIKAVSLSSVVVRSGRVSTGTGNLFEGGGVSIYSTQYDVGSAITSNVTYLHGDIVRPAQNALFAQSFS